jgi:carbonic anhydrase/SulP family sulfate permease
MTMPPPAQDPVAAAVRPSWRDLLAGLVVCAVAMPLCLGVAHASEAPLLSGVVSGVIGGVLVGLLSGSQIGVAGPGAGIAAIVVGQIHGLGSFEAFLLVVVLAGALQIALGLVGGGRLVHFVPNSVVRGLLTAIGVLLVLKQVPHLVGYDRDWEGDDAFAQADGDNTFSALWTALQRVVPGSALVGGLAFAALLLWDRFGRRATRVPSSLVAVVVGTAASELLRATGGGWMVGPDHLVTVPGLGRGGSGWREVLSTPDFGRLGELRVWLDAVTLMLVVSLETLLNREAIDRLDPLRRPTSPNRELVAQGLGNMVVGLCGGLPISSVVVRSSVSVEAGGRTRLAAISHGAFLLLGVVALPGLLNRVPLAALAAVLVSTGWRLVRPGRFVALWHEGASQFLPFLATVSAIVFTDLLTGVSIGLGTSLLFVFARSLGGGMREVREEHVSGVVHRIELGDQIGFLHRARLVGLLGRFRAGDQVAIDASGTEYIDPDLLVTIREFARDVAPARGVVLSLVGFQDRYQLANVVQYVDFTSREVQAKLTPAKVLDVLKAGNQRFVTGQRLRRDLARQVGATSAGQHPMAVVLSCIDSRAPVEILFDLGIGDVFSVRIAGNVARQKSLGSMEFACKVAGARLIVVLGHTKCGAVKATCDLVHKHLDVEAATGLTNLRPITDAIAEAVRHETATTEGRTADNPAFVDRVAAINVRHTIQHVVGHSPVLAGMLREGRIGLVGAMYDVASGRVEFLEGPLHGGAAG